MEQKYIINKSGDKALPITSESAVRDANGNPLSSKLGVINDALDARYTKSETYSKSQLDNLITTPNQKYVTVEADDQTTNVTDVLPATGEKDTIYRVGNWDGSAYDITCYSEYAWDGTAYKFLSKKSQIGEVYDISAANGNETYTDLNDALTSNTGGVPSSLRKGGMSVKFVLTSDNKYVQFRYMGTAVDGNPNPFLDIANWQGVDDEPTVNSNNLVKSGGVAAQISQLWQEVGEMNPLEYEESGLSSGNYPRFRTTNIYVSDGDDYILESSTNENYIIWNDDSYTAISSGKHKMVYPAGKTFKAFQGNVSSAGVLITISITIIPATWQSLVRDVTLASNNNNFIGGVDLSLNEENIAHIGELFMSRSGTTSHDYSSGAFVEGKRILLSLPAPTSTYVYDIYFEVNGTFVAIMNGINIAFKGIFILPANLGRIRVYSNNAGWTYTSYLVVLSDAVYLENIGNGIVNVLNYGGIAERVASKGVAEVVVKNFGLHETLYDGYANICTPIHSGNIKSGNKFKLTWLSGGQVALRGRSANAERWLTTVSSNSPESVVTLSQDWPELRLSGNGYGRLEFIVDGEIDIETINDSNLLHYEEIGVTDDSQYHAYDTTDIQVKNGDYFKYQSNAAENYIIWKEGGYTSIHQGWQQMVFPEGKTFKNFRALQSPSGTKITISVDIRPISWENIVRETAGVNTAPIRVLIIGDSYSANGGTWVAPMMSKLPTGSSYISLAVGSATLKDKYSDRETYPYTSRPVQSDSSGNRNTFACQIEKLKRLMAGTDLDAGETQIYTQESEYPNVIIIEGGKNDSPDSDEKVATYYSQLNKVVENVYVKETSSSAVVLGNATIKTPLDEINRTCFSGAYRYLLDELLELFPNAQIYFTTVSPIGYRTGSNVSERATTIANQQRICADIFSATIIDWLRDGQINSVANYAQGSGTQQDPYLTRVCDLEHRDTNDQLHPNARGGKKYGAIAARVIMNTFMDIESF